MDLSFEDIRRELDRRFLVRLDFLPEDEDGDGDFLLFLDVDDTTFSAMSCCTDRELAAADVLMTNFMSVSPGTGLAEGATPTLLMIFSTQEEALVSGGVFL